MSKISENDKQIQELREELERITADPELREKYDYREKELRDILSLVKAGKEEGYEKGVEKGIEQGIQQGIEENRIEVVLNMYKKNIDIETISEIVNISKEEAKRIIVESK